MVVVWWCGAMGELRLLLLLLLLCCAVLCCAHRLDALCVRA